ncbi:hypothetical protein GF389_03725 [Candidatus Dojkabacteria bacterium]|nr:hypothetical protein [Candidatus Dojkabacteria bacterium]
MDQRSIANLFNVNVPAISKHVRNILGEGELIEDGTVSKMEIVQLEGSRSISREVIVYNLDMIISVGYRVNSSRATQFRIWGDKCVEKVLGRWLCYQSKALRGE